MRKFSPRKCRYCAVEFSPRSASHAICGKCRRPKCAFCGERFTIKDVGNNPRFCTRRCSLSALHGVSKVCIECGKKVPRDSFKYCSRKCFKRIFQRRRMRSIAKERLEGIRFLGGECSKCGFSDVRALELHHIDRSRKIRPKVKHRHNILFRMADFRKNRDNFQVLCANCHRIETHETVWRHQRKLSHMEKFVAKEESAEISRLMAKLR